MTDQEQDRKYWIIGPDTFLHPFLCRDLMRSPFLLAQLIPLNSLNSLLSMKVLSVKVEFEDPDLACGECRIPAPPLPDVYLLECPDDVYAP